MKTRPIRQAICALLKGSMRRTLLLIGLLGLMPGMPVLAAGDQTGPELPQASGDGLRLRGAVGYAKGRDVPYLDQELELAWRFAGWRGRLELGLVYGLYFPVGGVAGGRPASELEDAVLADAASPLALPLGLRSLQGLQLRSRFYFFDPGAGPWGLEPFVSVQAGGLLANSPASRPVWVLPSFGLGCDWWLSRRFALSPALYVPFWGGSTPNPQFQAELALKLRF